MNFGRSCNITEEKKTIINELEIRINRKESLSLQNENKTMPIRDVFVKSIAMSYFIKYLMREYATCL